MENWINYLNLSKVIVNSEVDNYLRQLRFNFIKSESYEYLKYLYSIQNKSEHESRLYSLLINEKYFYELDLVVKERNIKLLITNMNVIVVVNGFLGDNIDFVMNKGIDWKEVRSLDIEVIISELLSYV